MPLSYPSQWRKGCVYEDRLKSLFKEKLITYSTNADVVFTKFKKCLGTEMTLKTFRKHYNELSQQWSNDMPATSSKKDSAVSGKCCYKYSIS